ncbi:hypothetical protein H7X46_00305 [Pseudonocardia sp. C8]|uniref:hypothetical protein n=1 Tax=Pseudonocardia sp. C8 TaxID=2762759 RepID=UPI001642CBF3|nr:hypothetical protein [Pseudonocardia sp. C8]MBC3189511.1 hypothetical protein [Pseudonocardia sp. C8]
MNQQRREPFYAGGSGCGAMVSGSGGPPSRCTGGATYAGLVMFATERRQEVWLSFACEQHVDRLDAPRRMLPRDQAVRDERRRNEQAARSARPYTQPKPLALGREARELHAKALRWAAAHTEAEEGLVP